MSNDLWYSVDIQPGHGEIHLHTAVLELDDWNVGRGQLSQFLDFSFLVQLRVKVTEEVVPGDVFGDYTEQVQVRLFVHYLQLVRSITDNFSSHQLQLAVVNVLLQSFSSHPLFHLKLRMSLTAP